ncbi:hypothetical protein CW706_03915 [Candidatus Bathyarchaeota archaeon]|nr:MAG: hypothetical protein CW706_03915 [Candidatus Bathyarchaeota archaeon]
MAHYGIFACLIEGFLIIGFAVVILLFTTKFLHLIFQTDGRQRIYLKCLEGLYAAKLILAYLMDSHYACHYLQL